MPLPNGDMQWPPKALNKITPKLAEWSAWYAGDTDQLADVYRSYRDTTRPRPSQQRGGVVGKVARWFWGQPTPDGQQRTKLHVPIAADIATASADLLFGEELQLDFGDANEAARERVEYLLEQNNWMATLAEAGEVASALGGSYLRVNWDDQVAEHALMSVMHADAAWPEFRFGRLIAVTFWQITNVEGSTVTRYLERHERGRIEYGLYQGTVDKLGRRVPLADSPVTADLTVDADSGIDTGYDGLTAQYLPNIKPQRRWRNDPVGAHLGRSDLDQQEPLMDALDETYTSWMRDIRLGKARIIVPSFMLSSAGPGQGAWFDNDREVFAALDAPPADEGGLGAQITPQQFAIRHAEHAATARDLMVAILRGAGFGPSTFGLSGDTAMTATEVDSRDGRSRSTREKKTRYATGPVQKIVEALAAVDAAKFSGAAGGVTVKVEFPPAATPSLNELAASVEILHRAMAASTETKVRLLHPDWDDKQVEDEVALILAESGQAVADLGPLPDDEEQLPVDDVEA